MPIRNPDELVARQICVTRWLSIRSARVPDRLMSGRRE